MKKEWLEIKVENLDGECDMMKLRKWANLYSGSRLMPETFSALKELGIKKIIDLKDPSETPFDEASLAQAAGLEYVNIPVHGMDSLDANRVKKIANEVRSEVPTLVYCMSANRVPAWLCRHLGFEKISDIETIIKLGQQMGLDRGPAIEHTYHFLKTIS